MGGQRAHCTVHSGEDSTVNHMNNGMSDLRCRCCSIAWSSMDVDVFIDQQYCRNANLGWCEETVVIIALVFKIVLGVSLPRISARKFNLT